MLLRRPAVAGSFYPREEAACRAALEGHLAEARLTSAAFTAAPARVGVVPHAGWVFSGTTAASTFLAFARASPPPRTFILLGAVHVPGVRHPSLYADHEAAWWTPLGNVGLDLEVTGLLLAADAAVGVVQPEAHEGEHSIEVQVPFVRLLFPEARIVPIAVPPTSSALRLGEALGAVLRQRPDVVVVASTDLTHYGPRYGFLPHGRGAAGRRWVRDTNDAEMLEAMTDLRAADVLTLSGLHHNACGPGALAAALQAARSCGAERGQCLAYTTSADARPDLGGEDFVGYASLAVAWSS